MAKKHTYITYYDLILFSIKINQMSANKSLFEVHAFKMSALVLSSRSCFLISLIKLVVYHRRCNVESL